MNPVKTYNQVNRKDETLSFGISKMEDVYTKRNGKSDTPHRHDFFTVVFTIQVTGKHIIDFNEYSLAANQVYFVAPGQVHQLIVGSPPIGFGMFFSLQFLIQNNIQISFIEDLNLFNDFGDSPPLELSKEAHEKVTNYFNEIYLTYHSDMAYKNDAIGALLKLILVQCNNSCTVPKDVLQGNGSMLRQFKTLINDHHKEWHATNEYASQLNITADHLNRVVKAQTGKTAKEHIQSRIIVAAKRMLYFSDLSNKEIGYELGFSEPANFSAFFKHCEGKTPSQFKSN